MGGDMSSRGVNGRAVLVAGIAVATACGGRPSQLPPTAASAYDTAVAVSPLPGIVHRRLVANRGPFRIHVLEIDLRRRNLSVHAARALDSLRGRERTSSIARRRRSDGEVVAAVNADFFSLRTGENENNQVVDGEVFKAIPVTDSPFDSLHTVHAQFGMTCDGRPVLDRFTFDGVVVTPPPAVALLPLDAVNFRPRRDALVLYTARFGLTPADSSSQTTAELPLRLAATTSDTLVYRITGSVRVGGGTALRDGEAVLSGAGIAADMVRRLGTSAGGELRVLTRFKPNRGRLCTLIGGWPRIVAGGKSIADSADILEGTFPRFSSTRHPRTGVGFSRDSTTLYLITVDGRQESSSGMSLSEFAELMRQLGVHHGLNLDGGGSTTMVVRGAVLNQPSDSTGERPVGNALLVVRK